MIIASLKILKPLGQYKKGETIKIETDDQYVPLNGFWRRRLKDSETDGCVELIVPDKSTKSAPKKKAK